MKKINVYHLILILLFSIVAICFILFDFFAPKKEYEEDCGKIDFEILDISCNGFLKIDIRNKGIKLDKTFLVSVETDRFQAILANKTEIREGEDGTLFLWPSMLEGRINKITVLYQPCPRVIRETSLGLVCSTY